MKEIIGKPELKIKKLSNRIAIDEKSLKPWIINY